MNPSFSSFKVGLELHVYIDVAQKLFCNCPIDYVAEPNTTVCPICTGQPGSKPLLPNKDAVDISIQVALMLGCTISEQLLFQRKHYSWPDLPNGFQKTMSGSHGLPVGIDGNFKDIGIIQCHLEEDPARWDPSTGTVDYNRSGYPLLEIVTAPDFHDVETVRQWLEDLTLALSYLRANNRVAGIKGDVNVSISPSFDRVEIKNINSFSAIIDAILHEVKRQSAVVSSGGKVAQETRAWSDVTQETLFMRKKEDAHDYRFIPEPDLPAITVDPSYVKVLRERMPLLPWDRKEQLLSLGLSDDDASVIVKDADLVLLYDKLHAINPLLVARWLRREVVRVSHYHQKTVGEMGFAFDDLKELLTLLENKKITEQVGQKIMEEIGDWCLVRSGERFFVLRYVTEQKLESVSDSSALRTICEQVIAANEKAVADYRAGSEKSLNYLVGQVMRQTRGAATPDVVLSMFKELLG